MHENDARWRTRLAFAGFAAIAAFFLITEHRAHFFGVLPFLFLLACPLLHVFAHGGHGGHGGNGLRHTTDVTSGIGSPGEAQNPIVRPSGNVSDSSSRVSW